MYEKFFALTKAPFSLVTDPSCIHLTAQHADAISGLAFAVLDRKGYSVLTGEAGLGKTTAVRALAELLNESNADSSIVLAPTLSGPEFLEMVLLNFRLQDIPSSKARRLKMLEEFLLQLDRQGRVAALIVDEAHQLSPELLEELRLLGNFETSEHKLLQIVLVGQNQLNDQLNLPQLWQFKQRITIRLTLKPLDRQGVEEYIAFRWWKAGGSEPLPFSTAALDAISGWSNGTPRLINVICDNALLIAFSETRREVDAQLIREACEELSLPVKGVLRNPPSFAGARLLQQPVEAAEETVLLPGEEAARENGDGRTDAWSVWRSSLLHKFGRRAANQEVRRTRSRVGILSLNEP